MQIIDHGRKFNSKILDQWAHENNVKLRFITLGRLMENGDIESFHGKFREECLNGDWFLTLEDACETIEYWRMDYNQVRQHSSLAYRTRRNLDSNGHADLESKHPLPRTHSPD